MEDDMHRSPRAAARSRWIAPSLVAALAAALALLFSLVIYPSIREPLAANIDPDKLGDLASNLASGEGFVYSGAGKLEPEFDRGPGYPALVAAVMFLGRTRSFIPVQVLQSLLHGLTTFLVFIIASRLHPGKIALAAEALCAVHPMLLWYTARVWIETTHTTFVTMSLLLLISLAEDPGPARAIGAGVVLGITALVKSILLPFSILAAALIVLRGGTRAVPAAGILVLTATLVVLPWTVRNYAESGHVIPVHTSLGLNRVQGDAIGMNWTHMPFSTLDLWMTGKQRIDSLLEGTGATPIDPVGDRILAVSSFRMSLADPAFALKRTAINLLTFCYMSESRAKSIFLAFIQFPVFALACVGSYRLWKRVPRSQVCVLLFVYFFLVHALIVGWARYSVPIVPAALVLAFGVFPRKSESPAGAPHA